MRKQRTRNNKVITKTINILSYLSFFEKDFKLHKVIVTIYSGIYIYHCGQEPLEEME